jgi:hypothetical protein
MLVLAAEGALVPGLVIAAFTAVLGWLVGNQVSYAWDERKRRRESDLAVLASFYWNYGQFFATWKLWDVCKSEHAATALPPKDAQWTLLQRASDAEGGFESVLVKIASERKLGPRETLLLACFREGYQSLRESIREDRRLEWWANHDEDDDGARKYRAFKALGEHVATMLEHDSGRGRGREPVSAQTLLTSAADRVRPGRDQRRRREDDERRDDAIANLLAVSVREDLPKDWWKVAENSLKLTQLAAKLYERLGEEISSLGVDLSPSDRVRRQKDNSDGATKPFAPDRPNTH